MKATLYDLIDNNWIPFNQTNTSPNDNCQLVIAFGDKKLLQDPNTYSTLSSKFQSSDIVLCSTAGEIRDTEVTDGCCNATALSFDHTQIKSVKVRISDYASSCLAGKALAEMLHLEGLTYVMILSDGSLVNGTDLMKGLDSIIPKNVLITGGLAGDGDAFQSTGVGLNGVAENGNIVALGFYGDKLKVGFGSMGGWDVFGPEKTITESTGNVLYQIDGRNALELYKEYLGRYAEELPGSALLFPLSISVEGTEETLVRTILSIDNENQSLTFAGDVPKGSKVRFMKANFDNLIGAASKAANLSATNQPSKDPDYALLISCVGRKIILKHRTEEEVESVAENFSPNTVISGFYSYGELSPFNNGGKCQLHNQTMTITTFKEN